MGHLRPIVGALAVIALLLIWPPLGALAFVVCLIVGLVQWVNGNSDSRPCPRCGEAVPNGVLRCEHCAFDFNAIGAAQ
jgi:predicted RNA-binding Zn-ribbon protein involved in translation (DUF1610 family)